jgi:hypothetical protein
MKRPVTISPIFFLMSDKIIHTLIDKIDMDLYIYVSERLKTDITTEVTNLKSNTVYNLKNINQ